MSKNDHLDRQGSNTYMPPKTVKRRKTGRSNVTTACTACRQVKVKCDGLRPKCSQCQSKGLSCQYETGKDKRRLALRKVIEACSERIQQLESYILSLDKEVPSPLSIESAALLNEIQITLSDKPDPTDELDKNSPQRSPFLTQSGSHGTPLEDRNDRNDSFPRGHSPDFGQSMSHPDDIPSGLFEEHLLQEETLAPLPELSNLMSFREPERDDLDWSFSLSADQNSYSTSLDAPLNSGIPPVSSSIIDSGGCVFPDLDDYSDDDGSDGEIIRQLSTRLGGLEIIDDGTLRFLGPTSNMTFGAVGSLYNFGHARDLNSSHVRIKVEDFISPTQFQHFANLYFCWQNSFLPLVEREVFEDDLRSLTDGQNPLFCSEPLKLSIAALGAVLDSNSRATVPNSMAQAFTNHAIALLECDYDCPRIATVQSFAILSCYEGLRTRDTRGWLYAGMAMRLALDLGLHIDTSTFVLAGTMTNKIARARRLTFWGAYINDQLWSFYLGRPLSTQSYEISLSAPMIGSTEPEPSWTPYRTKPAEGVELAQRPPSACTAVFVQSFVNLCEEMSTLASKLYGSIKSSNDELVDRAATAFVKLQHWKETLDPQLKFDHLSHYVVPAAHILLLHIQYHVFVIILHRPFVSKSATQPYPLRGKGPYHAREMCITSALEISKLLQIYETTYGLSIIATPVVHATFSAALILIYATLSHTNISTPVELSDGLAVCCRALSVLGNRFESAARALDTLLAVRRKWQSILVVGAGHKRSSSGRQNNSLFTGTSTMGHEPHNHGSFGVASGSEDGIISQQLADFVSSSARFGGTD